MQVGTNIVTSFYDRVSPLQREDLYEVIPSVMGLIESVEWGASDKRIADRRISDRNHADPVVLARDATGIIGYAILVAKQPSGRTKAADTWYISQLVVHPDKQRHGVGTEIMNLIFARAVENNIHTIELDAQGDNFRAISFYAKAGNNYSQDADSLGQVITQVYEGTPYRSGEPKIVIDYTINKKA